MIEVSEGIGDIDHLPAGVLDLEAEPVALLGLDPQDDAAAGRRELERVRQVVVRDLLEPACVEVDAPTA